MTPVSAFACADTHRPRQLIVCCDGTNNTLTARVQDTNVLRLYEHLRQREHSDPERERLFYYDPGVGNPGLLPPTDPVDWAKRFVERLSGLASGRGVYEDISQAYLFLMRHWRDERDRIYCFGFSRGAFTARCVVGMVHLFGLLKPEHEVLLPTLIHIYFSLPAGRGAWWQRTTRWLHLRFSKRPRPLAADDPRQRLAWQISDAFTGPQRRDAWVHWVGVWDTVESVGLPGPLARSNPSTATLVGKRIRHVRHALAFDEHRWTFEPRLYEEPGDIDDAATGQTLRQRWFAGAHCDVGGGYHAGEAALSNHTLRWMLDELRDEFGPPEPGAPGERAELADPGSTGGHAEPRATPAIVARPVRHDALYDTPWWALAGMCLRDMQPKTASRAASAARRASPGHPGVAALPARPIAVLPGPPAVAAGRSVWTRRRAAWPLAVALAVGAVCLLLSGACLSPQGWREIFPGPWISVSWPDAANAAQRAAAFAGDQWASIQGHGLLADPPWNAYSGTQPGWAMFWDLGFVACWGYVVARVSSRGFAWLAGARQPGDALPLWRVLGMAPLAAVGGDVAEDAFTLLALALHGVGVDTFASAGLWLGGVAGTVKWAGLLGCAVWCAVRLWIALPGVPSQRA